MERVILHSDANNFYASIECLYNPELRGKPVIVCGNSEKRHGIVLAKNYEAKKYGIQTGDPIWMAKQKCSESVVVEPNYDRYIRFSNIAREIYSDYTDCVEAFGLDECWLDVTDNIDAGDGKRIADEIRKRVRFELGITVSVGVSFNKVFAKLGSDMNKPDATTIISRDNFKRKVWPLDVKELLYIGRSTRNTLKRYCINTIGDLANTDLEFLQYKFGKIGEMLWLFANGLDTSPVSNIGAKSLIKSIGNSTTAPRDLITDEDVRITLYILCESVAERLREYNFLCSTIKIFIKDNELESYERQCTSSRPTNNSNVIFGKAFELFKKHHVNGKPVRCLGVRAANLSVDDSLQLSLLPEDIISQKRDLLERTIDCLRSRFGHYCVQRGIMLTDRQLSQLDPKNEHIIFPESFLKA